jgi:hypothetical protein
MKKTTSTHKILIFPALLVFLVSLSAGAQVPAGYTGKPFSDDTLGFIGPQVIPGRIELAYYDFGGEGVAYHDSTATNDGAILNHQCFDYGCHWRPGIPYHIAFFRENEGVDISYTKDWADYKKPNVVEPRVNQLYIGWESNGEWLNYTVDVKSPDHNCLCQFRQQVGTVVEQSVCHQIVFAQKHGLLPSMGPGNNWRN